LLAVLAAVTILAVVVALADIELDQVLLFLAAQLTQLLLVVVVQQLPTGLILYLAQSLLPLVVLVLR
jgi:hypothetical protein